MSLFVSPILTEIEDIPSTSSMLHRISLFRDLLLTMVVWAVERPLRTPHVDWRVRGDC